MVSKSDDRSCRVNWPKVIHITTIDLSLRYLLLNLLRSLLREGYVVIGISSPGPDVPTLEAAGIRHIAVPMTRRLFTPLKDAQAVWLLYRVIRRERPTIVHTHTPKAGIYGRWAARLAGVPIVLHTSHGLVFHERSPWLWRRCFVALERLAAGCSDLIFSVSTEDVRTAVREGVWPAGKIRSLGTGGVDTELFSRDRIPSGLDGSKRAEIGLPHGLPVVGFVGRLVREKGLLELLAAARIVRQRIPTVRFLIIGPVDREKSDALTPDAAREYGVADICCFLGMRQDMPELYALMDVFVLPSHREGFPRAPMEASAMGVPCIVTDIRGCREVVKHDRNGILVPPGNSQALANAITRLLTDRDTARQMGEEGRRMARERFDEHPVFEQVKAEYARLLKERGFPLPDPTALRGALER